MSGVAETKASEPPSDPAAWRFRDLLHGDSLTDHGKMFDAVVGVVLEQCLQNANTDPDVVGMHVVKSARLSLTDIAMTVMHGLSWSRKWCVFPDAMLVPPCMATVFNKSRNNTPASKKAYLDLQAKLKNVAQTAASFADLWSPDASLLPLTSAQAHEFLQHGSATRLGQLEVVQWLPENRAIAIDHASVFQSPWPGFEAVEANRSRIVGRWSVGTAGTASDGTDTVSWRHYWMLEPQTPMSVFSSTGAQSTMSTSMFWRMYTQCLGHASHLPRVATSFLNVELDEHAAAALAPLPATREQGLDAAKAWWESMPSSTTYFCAHPKKFVEFGTHVNDKDGLFSRLVESWCSQLVQQPTIHVGGKRSQLHRAMRGDGAENPVFEPLWFHNDKLTRAGLYSIDGHPVAVLRMDDEHDDEDKSNASSFPMIVVPLSQDPATGKEVDPDATASARLAACCKGPIQVVEHKDEDASSIASVVRTTFPGLSQWRNIGNVLRTTSRAVWTCSVLPYMASAPFSNFNPAQSMVNALSMPLDDMLQLFHCNNVAVAVPRQGHAESAINDASPSVQRARITTDGRSDPFTACAHVRTLRNSMAMSAEPWTSGVGLVLSRDTGSTSPVKVALAVLDDATREDIDMLDNYKEQVLWDMEAEEARNKGNRGRWEHPDQFGIASNATNGHARPLHAMTLIDTASVFDIPLFANVELGEHVAYNYHTRGIMKLVFHPTLVGTDTDLNVTRRVHAVAMSTDNIEDALDAWLSTWYLSDLATRAEEDPQSVSTRLNKKRYAWASIEHAPQDKRTGFVWFQRSLVELSAMAATPAQTLQRGDMRPLRRALFALLFKLETANHDAYAIHKKNILSYS